MLALKTWLLNCGLERCAKQMQSFTVDGLESVLNDGSKFAFVLSNPRCSLVSQSVQLERAQLTRRPIRRRRCVLKINSLAQLLFASSWAAYGFRELERRLEGRLVTAGARRPVHAGGVGVPPSFAGSQYQTVVVWLREGENLRLHDNPVIEKALALSREGASTPDAGRSSGPDQSSWLPTRLLPIFIETPWDKHGRLRTWRQQKQVRECVQFLGEALHQTGSGLVWVRVSDTHLTRLEDMANLRTAALVETLASLELHSLTAVTYPCGGTRLQGLEEEILVQRLGSSTDADAAANALQRRAMCRAIRLVSVQDTANTLFALARLPFSIAKMPDDCDAFAQALDTLGEPEPSQHAPVSLPPLPREALDSPFYYNPEIVSGKPPMVDSPDAHQPFHEQFVLEALEAYAKSETPLVMIADDTIQTRSQGILGVAMELGCLSPRRFWHAIREHLPTTSIRRQCAWFDIILHDFVRLLTWKRGIHPA